MNASDTGIIAMKWNAAPRGLIAAPISGAKAAASGEEKGEQATGLTPNVPTPAVEHRRDSRRDGTSDKGIIAMATDQFKPYRPFDIPRAAHNSTGGARREYIKSFGQPWSGTDDELRQMVAAIEFQTGAKLTCNDLLIHMREQSA